MDNLYSSVSKGGCYDTNHYGPRPLPLLKLNYLSEYLTEAEKELVRKNLGIHNDSLIEDFIIHNKFLLGLIPGHEDSEKIDTIYGTFCYLFEDIDLENARINNLDNYSEVIEKLTGISKNNSAEYSWPTSVSAFNSGYLNELNSSIQEAFNKIEEVRGDIGTLPDGSDVLSYILEKNKELEDLIKDSELNTSNALSDIKEGILDLTDRLLTVESITLEDATYIADRIKEYTRQLNNINAKINGGTVINSDSSQTSVIGVNKELQNAQNSLNSSIESILNNIKSILGENGENPTGLYAEIKSYKDTLTSDFNSFELTLSLDLNDLKLEIGSYTEEDTPAHGLRKEVEEVLTNVTNYLNSCKLDLETKRDEVIGNPASEEISATGIYKTIDDYTGIVSTKINDTVQKAEQAAKETEKLVNGDPEAEEGSDARKSLALRVADVSAEIQKAETAKNEVIAANLNLGNIRLHTRTGLAPQVSINGPEATKDLTLGALNFYVQGYHWRGYAPALGNNEIQTIDATEESINSWRQAYNLSTSNTRDYAGAFGLNFGKSDTVDVSLNTRTYNKTGKVSDKYQIPTLEFEATNVEIVDETVDPNKVFKTLHILIVDKKPDNPVDGVFYFVKLA